MNVRNEINREDLLNCGEGDDEKEQLIEFYERNLPFLKKFPKKTVMADIAIMIHKTTLLDKIYWREYAEILGITDNHELDKIEVSAENNQEPQLYTVFTRVLPSSKGFDHVIRMLIIKKRFDVLKRIQDIAEELIEESRDTHVKGLIKTEPQYTSDQLTSSVACSIEELVSEAFSDSNNCHKSDAYTCIQNPASHIKKDFDSLQQCSQSDYCKSKLMIPDSTVVHENLEQNVPLDKYIVPTAPMQENLTESKISVFILHTKSDTSNARQLREKLKIAGFDVKTMSDMEVLLAMNDVKALHAIFEEVDFIVPVVSESLFKVIHTPHLNKSTDDVNNHIFYQWIMNEYQNNNCINYRVRPVIVPGMNRQKLIKDIILKFSFRLEVEDDKLIKILRETKDLIPNYHLQ